MDRTRSFDCCTLLDLVMRLSVIFVSLPSLPRLAGVASFQRPSLLSSSKSTVRTKCSKFLLTFRVGGAILTNELEDLALSLSFLNRLGLYPVVLHGAGPQL